MAKKNLPLDFYKDKNICTQVIDGKEYFRFVDILRLVYTSKGSIKSAKDAIRSKYPDHYFKHVDDGLSYNPAIYVSEDGLKEIIKNRFRLKNLEVQEIRRIRALEKENDRLNKSVEIPIKSENHLTIHLIDTEEHSEWFEQKKKEIEDYIEKLKAKFIIKEYKPAYPKEWLSINDINEIFNIKRGNVERFISFLRGNLPIGSTKLFGSSRALRYKREDVENLITKLDDFSEEDIKTFSKRLKENIYSDGRIRYTMKQIRKSREEYKQMRMGYNEKSRYAELLTEKKGRTKENIDVGFLYLFKFSSDSTQFKIGKTMYNPIHRLNALRTGNINIEMVKYWKVSLYGELEKELHGLLGDKRVSREWFDLDKEDLDFIENVCNEWGKRGA